MVLGQQGKHNVDPSKVEVGEIDTSSPFESVKHAVSLFGAVAFMKRRTQPSSKKPESPSSSEKVSVKESKLHLAEKELKQLKQNLHDAELTRTRAVAELEKTRKTINELNTELSAVSKLKDVVLEETDKLNHRVKNVQEDNSVESSDGTTTSAWKTDMDTFRVQYLAAALELNAAKQELGEFRLDFDSAMRSYKSVVRQATEAEAATKANNEEVIKLSGEISSMKELIEEAKIASEHADEEKAKIESSRETLAQEYKTKLDESTKNTVNLKITLDHEASKNLQKELDSIVDQTGALNEEICKAKASYSELATMLNQELETANATLEKLVDEDASLRRLIASLNDELENVKKEILELNKKEAVTKNLAEDLEAELQKVKLELEASIAAESNTRSTYNEMTSTVVSTMAETKRARQEAKEVASETEAFMKEAEDHKNTIKEHEAKLQELLHEVEEAKSAEAKALEEIKFLSETKDSAPKVTLSKEEFNTLNLKVKDSATIADMKVSVAMVQVEAVNTRHSNRLKQLEENLEELDKIKLTTSKALKTEEDAEAVKMEMENELINLGYHKNWEIELEPEAESSPAGLTRSCSTNSATRRRVTLGDILKMDREGREMSKRSPLRSLSGIFHRS